MRASASRSAGASTSLLKKSTLPRGIAGRQIELVYEDSEASPAVAVTKAEKLFNVDNVDFLTGTVNSGATLAVGQVADRAGKLLATTVSFSDAITGTGCSPNVFRVNARARPAIGSAGRLAEEGKAGGKSLLPWSRL
ncbi:ABC transporter substrate-binding protein [Hoeflea alexandrii]|uniref:ABC transporter substrate-binding protein n=1 Tax=Hoeflea alexandrii TaxID=288436 RepID=UPI00226FA898|nr:ABC transporter substrate-binding protein [Hoeflea alexandrii]MCY0155005.1 ABC transporter substrate-binding protein [Hoeflea alexandrii]